MKTLFPLVILFVVAYLALSFVEWQINPAHWSIITRAGLLVLLLLVSLKPLADWLRPATNTRDVSDAEFEQNQSVFRKALSMNVGGLTPDERESVRNSLAKAQALLDKLADNPNLPIA